MKDAERLARTRRWFDVIEGELQRLLIDNHVFWEIQEVVRRNPRFEGIPGLVTQWMASCFIQAAVSGVRRQVKLDKDSISLRRLLVELQTYPQLVTREMYLEYFEDSPREHQDVGAREFDQWSGGGKQLDPKVVETDVSRLVAAAAPIEAYGDCRVAHYDQRGLAGPMPTFAELTDCLQVLDETFTKYHVLLRGSSLSTALPTILPDWQAIFTFPWSE
jgi:hypothetical protein